MTDVVPELIEAGRDAVEKSAWDLAFRLLSEADEDQSLAPGDLEDLAKSAWWSGKNDECIDARERAFAGYSEAGESRRAGMMAVALAEDNFHRGATAVGHAWLKRADQNLQNQRTSAEYGYLTRSKAMIAFEAEEDLETAIDLARRAHKIGVDSESRDLQAVSLHDLGRITVARGEVDEGMALLDEAMVAAVSGELGAMATGKIYCNMIDICEQLADYRRAGDWTDAAKRWCERSGNSSGFPGVCRVHRAEIMRLRGDWDSAEQEARLASSELGNFVDFAGEAFYEIGEIRFHLGDFEGAQQAYRQAHGNGRDPQPGMALLQLAQGNTESAWNQIRQSLTNTRAPLKRARLLPGHIEIALAHGEVEDAEMSVVELESIAGEYGSSAFRAHAEHGRGMLLMATGQAEAASEHLQRATEMWRVSDVPYQSAKSRLLLGLAYRDRGALDMADMELRAARTTFEKLGAMHDVRLSTKALQEGSDPASPERDTKALMFTDIVSSTPLMSAIGDDGWEKLLRWHDRTLRSLFATSGGQEIDHAGDGFFVSFDSPSAAVECASAIQRTLWEQRESQGFAPDVRIGLHSGEVTQLGERLTGENVHKAARICALAAGEEILASTDFIAIANSSHLPAREVELKGFADPIQVAAVPWD